MRRLIGLLIASAALALGATYALGADGPKKPPEDPKSRSDWPTERVLVLGNRGNPRDWIVNHTFRGTEGFADGSAPPNVESRSEFPWQIYYAADGTLEAHFHKLGSNTPHGEIIEQNVVEHGTWRFTPSGELCQTIPRVGWGIEVCFWIDKRGGRMAMYYTNCGADSRCYIDRLGPEGDIVPGRQFTI
jgi:hypothetical protein